MKPYKFKKYYEDGTIECNGGRASKPEYLYGEFDGMVTWEEYDNIATSNLTPKELLNIALKVFNKTSKTIKRIEIIDYIENKEID